LEGDHARYLWDVRMGLRLDSIDLDNCDFIALSDLDQDGGAM
jgi:hypothetical protein